ncbi:MAG: hypothetical protein ACREGD_03825 [Candidatus Saccharimonadales bacterium]
MDPQKLPDANRPTPTNPPSPSGLANDISTSEESSVPPGTVVVGGQPAPPTAPGNTPTPPAPENATATPEADPKMAAFMRGDTPSDMPTPAKKKTGMIVGIVAAVLLLVGGGAAAYVAFFMPKPDKVLQAALVSTFTSGNLKSAAFEGELSVADSSSDFAYTVGFEGASSQTAAQFALSVDIPLLSPVTLDARTLDGGQTYYVRAGGLASTTSLLATEPSLAPFAPLLASLNNQWYEVDLSTLEELSGTSEGVTGSLSDAERQRIVDAYSQNQFLTVTEVLADEPIAGVDSYHYKVTVDGDKLQAFLDAVGSVESFGITGAMLDGLQDMLLNVDFTTYLADVWIAKDTKFFTQFALATQSGETSLNMRLTLKDFNKEVTVEQPEGALPFQDAITSFYQVLLGGSLPLL